MQVISHNYGRGARALSERISNGRLLLKRSTRRIPARVVVNFGVQDCPRLQGYNGTLLNRPHAIQSASDKKVFLLSEGFRCRRPHATRDRNEVYLSLSSDRQEWFVRELTRADSGRGITVLKPSSEIASPDDVPPAPLYVQSIRKDKEYRVHIGKAPDGAHQVIDIRRKARRSDLNNEDGGRENWPDVWNHDNGFIFKARGVRPDTVPADVVYQASVALSDTQLDFAAIDIVYDGTDAYVLEVNTAPGLEGRTLDRYAEFFRQYEGGDFTIWQDLDFNQLEQSVLREHS